MGPSGCSGRVIASVVLPLLFALPGMPTSAQTIWFKYTGNPVLDLGPKGMWDDDWVHIDRVLLEDSVYQMWYTGGWQTARIGYATSRDGITWRRDRANPVLDVRRNTWEPNVSRGYVIFAGGKYHMWYTGDDVTTFRVGYATSRDGRDWVRYPGNPVLDVGPPGAWDEGFAGLVSVVGPDSSGGFKLWYQGKGMKIGFATATNATTWHKYPMPVFWGEGIAFYPRVLYDGHLYEMWCGTRDPAVQRSRTENPQPGVLVYATSPDGIDWTKSPHGPVLRPGPDGAWDDAGLVTGDVLFDGRTYHLWYEGDDGSGKWRGGYAVSPRHAAVTVSASNTYVRPGTDTVHFAVRVADPKGLSFYVRVRTTVGRNNPEFPLELLGMNQTAVLDLYDDGKHGDSLASDGIFANRWTPEHEEMHFVDVGLKLAQPGAPTGEVQSFETYKAAVFSSIGPVVYDRLEFIKNPTPGPGDTVLFKVILRNQGASVAARSVSASLTSDDPTILEILESVPQYGDIGPGKTASTLGHHGFVVNPYASSEKEVAINVVISSWGIPLWRDTFTIRVVPPWWRRPWAYAAYVVLLAATVGGTIRYTGMRKLKKRVRQLEREQALERERARISQDMHDEVGATLTEISILTELARRKPDAAGDQLRQISERSAEVIDNLGEIVWAINPKNDTLDNFVAYLRRHAVKYTGAANIRCRFASPEQIPSIHIPSEKRRNTYLVVKEALHNVVKHASATEVTVALTLRGDGIDLQVSDNGKGFSVDRHTGAGNGLGNMKKRMSDIGGTFAVTSGPERGTTVSISISLANS
jgi:signal transduction histidine kinase